MDILKKTAETPAELEAECKEFLTWLPAHLLLNQSSAAANSHPQAKNIDDLCATMADPKKRTHISYKRQYLILPVIDTKRPSLDLVVMPYQPDKHEQLWPQIESAIRQMHRAINFLDKNPKRREKMSHPQALFKALSAYLQLRLGGSATMDFDYAKALAAFEHLPCFEGKSLTDLCNEDFHAYSTGTSEQAFGKIFSMIQRAHIREAKDSVVRFLSKRNDDEYANLIAKITHDVIRGTIGSGPEQPTLLLDVGTESASPTPSPAISAESVEASPLPDSNPKTAAAPTPSAPGIGTQRLAAFVATALRETPPDASNTAAANNKTQQSLAAEPKPGISPSEKNRRIAAFLRNARTERNPSS
jgi:hypothetical protein